MLIRIVKPMQGILDGVSLTTFVPGALYDVEASLALQLVALGGAARSDLSRSHADFQELVHNTDAASLIGGVSVVPPSDKASDRSSPKGHKRR